MLKKELQFYKSVYRQNLFCLQGDKTWQEFAVKKYIHSIQVLQTGRQILEAETQLSSLPAEQKHLIESALLFHDIGRFKEACHMHDIRFDGSGKSWFGHKFDHGMVSAEIISSEPAYNDWRLILPLRHHGHLIEALYADSDYQRLNANSKQEVNTIISVVRDADKLANLYAIKYKDNFRKEPFFLTCSEELKFAPASPGVLHDFLNRQAVKTMDIRSWTDRILCTLAWIHDFNFRSSVKILQREQYHRTLFKELDIYTPDESVRNEIKSTFEKFLSERLS